MNQEKSSEQYGAEGGRRRAALLSPEQRREIARAAAEARWEAEGRLRIRATHEGQLSLGQTDLTVAVLDGGVRVVRSAAVLAALGRPWRGQYKRTGLPSFLEAKNLKPFITNELESVLEVVEYIGLTGKRQIGYRAEIVPLVCEVYLRAREAGALTATQRETARLTELLTRALSRVGITALIDEATGYQEVRDRLALQKILEAYLSHELAAWAKRFPDEFYMELFRIRGWTWDVLKKGRGQGGRVVGKYTNDLVYARLAPGILEELQRRNPTDERGRRKAHHHRWLTEDVGHAALAQHLHAVTGLMRAAETWDQFQQLINKAFPRRTSLKDLPLFNGQAA